MEASFSSQAQLRNRRGLHRVRAVPNRNYQRHGTKSYVSALNRFGFKPTKPGPYFQKFSDSDGKTVKVAPGVKPGRTWEGLFKTIKGEGTPGKITAEDQQNDTEYLCEVLLGTPPQRVMLDLDTGSADLWVSRKSFDPKTSSTFQLAGDKSWKIQYGDGSSASGDVGTDVVSIGNLKIQNQAVEIAKDMSAQFSQGAMDGLLGLAFRQINTIRSRGKPDPQPTLLDNMISQEDIPRDCQLFTSAMYSTRGEAHKSFYTFGWIDEDLAGPLGKSIQWTDIDNSGGFWMFPSEQVTINWAKIPLAGNKAIADTGTTLALLSDKVCDALYSQIKGAEYSEKYQGYTIPRDIEVAALPDFRIMVGGNEFQLQKEDLLFAPADDKVWYGGVQSRGENPFDILGGTFLKSIYAIWDQGNRRFGAVPKLEKNQSLATSHIPFRKRDMRPNKIAIRIAYGDISSTYA